ncbi:MAG: DUF2953 domain-containing protein [Clostridium sp.]|jgi:hypothetical protein|uniref:DUF2953 domain-containing protein n=1 Tax=Clostridium sp. TaxID=1506 RepID=UPI0025BE9F58|nr:DUF2953 domain-containing protein [Clostridium sp.]MCH3965978.1 DUF2953 domain-containing protein [Clostridium sp.]MCI1715934.1 DUF2953 domain-containing protein [Clostridium sp.]MCI1800394.1 DUF2953 domain-containing protein [Clostridium sp.]MCI1814111.1 DUF2953 domain-containing protein [Clostridium sp.]MCI1871009.1 DUF2953 domain-containing protein [Clostridium sp.]
MTILYIMLDMILVIIAAAVIFLMLPVKYSVDVLMEDRHVSFNFKVALIFNMILLEGGGCGKDIEINIKIFFFKKKLNLKTKKTRNTNRKFNFTIHDLLTNIKEYKNHFHKILDKLRPEYFKLEGKYGFSDPSCTGMLAGLIYMVRPFFKFSCIDIKPDFLEEELYISMGICGKIRPVVIINFGGVSWILKKMQRRFFQSLKTSLKQKPS